MQGDIVQFTFYLIGHMLRHYGANGLGHAIAMAADTINVVFDAHNKVVRDMQAEKRAYYYVDTSNPYMSDNQCCLLGMLREDTIYKHIEEHKLIDMGIYPAGVAPSKVW